MVLASDTHIVVINMLPILERVIREVLASTIVTRLADVTAIRLPAVVK